MTLDTHGNPTDIGLMKQIHSASCRLSLEPFEPLHLTQGGQTATDDLTAHAFIEGGTFLTSDVPRRNRPTQMDGEDLAGLVQVGERLCVFLFSFFHAVKSLIR